MSENDDDTTAAEQESKKQRAEGVERMLSGESPPTEPEVNDPVPPGEVGGASKVGETITKRGEDVAKDKEAGRVDTGTEGDADRPTGTSTTRDRTGVHPHDDDKPSDQAT